ncbi:MAG: putative transporter substrate-binding protein, partial [Friedmanniella sp.]|nr:putative transporter substrate-binding protein [Friedmanniella sp.]
VRRAGRGPGRRRTARTAGAAGLVLVLAAACQLPGPTPAPTPTSGSTPRPFTIMSTDPIRVTDPAAMADSGSAVLSTNVFQRLMTSDPGSAVLKPDAARDCLFTAATTYTCTLNKNLTFSNGHPLTSSDVKFSLQRATRLNVAGSSASLLSSLRRIETPDDLTVRFLLSRVDTQFGWALASPAASIVDEEVYDADEIRQPDRDIVGSGPFRVEHYDRNDLLLHRFESYVGRTPASRAELVYVTAPDSATIEDAMTKGTVEVVWRGLDDAALTRYTQQVQASPDKLTVGGYQQRILPGTRVVQLLWGPGSPSRADKGLRQAIATALQGDRTLDSVVPNGVPGHASSFPVGGRATPKVTWKNRITLTLGYDPTSPNGQDIAIQIRTRLEEPGGLSVQLRPGDFSADLNVVDRKAWAPTALAWLQPYLDAPLPAAASTLDSIVTEFRRTTTDTTADQQLSALQKQAAFDQTVVPLSQSDEYVYLRRGVDLSDTSFAPGWQLGFWGITNG